MVLIGFGYNGQPRSSGRENEFEPQVIQEPKALRDQRANLRSQHQLIEKAKRVDIGMTVRVLEDAYLNAYRGCLLFTSDVDFLPVIEAVRRIGKLVFVAGYREGLAERSPLEYVPDRFIDLGN